MPLTVQTSVGERRDVDAASCRVLQCQNAVKRRVYMVAPTGVPDVGVEADVSRAAAEQHGVRFLQRVVVAHHFCRWFINRAYRRVAAGGANRVCWAPAFAFPGASKAAAEFRGTVVGRACGPAVCCPGAP